jgi:hypothetical protein
MRRSLIVAVLAAIMVVAMAGAAFAGEITGNGKSLKNDDGSLNGHSACAFSGQNDTFIDADTPDEDGFTRTQSWGQLSKEDKVFLKSVGFNPGIACNPTKGDDAH